MTHWNSSYSEGVRLMGSRNSGRHSAFHLEPYTEEIHGFMDKGCTYQKTADAISFHFDSMVPESAVAYFCRKHGIKSRITQGCRKRRINIPHCDECDSCKLVENVSRNRRFRVCTEEWLQIGENIYTSPMDCPKRDIEKYCEGR